MMFWEPSGPREAKTTEGDEYALDVTHVQCRTKTSMRKTVLPMTANRVSRP
jgi:hypothetical protein